MNTNNINGSHVHRWLTAGAAAAYLLVGMTPVALAEEAADAAEAPADEIIVQGIRASLDNAVSIKRNASSVVDAISAEDIGDYPDVNVAESVQRISGVQINRSRGEGQSVNIRGLPSVFTQTTLNGRSVANALVNADATATRAFDFSILAPEFVRSLEVYKAPTADLEEGGLSGTVNIRTPRALTIGKRVLAGSIQAEYSDSSGKVTPSASALYADTFADDRLGVTLGISYSKRRPETHAVGSSYNYVREGTALGSSTVPADLNGDGVIDPQLGVRIPGNLNYSISKEERERIGAIGSVEFQVTDNLKLYTEGLYSKLNVHSERSENNWFLVNSRGLVGSTLIDAPFDGIPTVEDIELTQLDLRANGRVEDSSGHLSNIVVGGEWERDRLRVEVSGGRSSSRQLSSNVALATTFIGHGYFATEQGDKIPSAGFIDGSIAASQNPANYRVASVNGLFRSVSTDRQYDGRIDITRQFSNQGLTQIAIGGRYADRARYQDNRRLTVLPAGVSALYGGLPAGSISGSFSAEPLMHFVGAGRGTFLDSYGGAATFPRELLVSNPAAFLLQQSAEDLIAAGTYTNDPSGITDVKEESFAGYVRGDFAFGRLTGNIGVRVVRTNQRSVGVSPDLSAITIDLRAGSVTRVPAAEPATVERSYTEVLPSLNLRYEVNDKLQLRFGLSRTMARPNLSDIAPTTMANGHSLTITRKNPYLDAFLSDNVDVAAEWYFARGAVLGVSGFYKSLSSLIRNVATIQTLPVQVIGSDGSLSSRDLTFTVNDLTNASGVKLKGFELYYQQPFTFLPEPFDGLGISANYTFIDNSDPEKLTAASRHNYNVTGYYEKGPVGVRLSYAWRGSYLSTAPEVPGMGIRTAAFGTLDGSASFKLTENVSLAVEAVNILGAAQSTRFLTALPNNYTYSGRRFLIGGRVSF